MTNSAGERGRPRRPARNTCQQHPSYTDFAIFRLFGWRQVGAGVGRWRSCCAETRRAPALHGGSAGECSARDDYDETVRDLTHAFPDHWSRADDVTRSDAGSTSSGASKASQPKTGTQPLGLRMSAIRDSAADKVCQPRLLASNVRTSTEGTSWQEPDHRQESVAAAEGQAGEKEPPRWENAAPVPTGVISWR